MLPAVSYGQYSSPEWFDANNDGTADVVSLPPYVVDGNDPATFDWSGYYAWCAEVEIITPPTPDFNNYEDFWGWAGATGSGSTSYTGPTWQDTVKQQWSSGSNSKGNCARYALGDPLGAGQNAGNNPTAHSTFPGWSPGMTMTPSFGSWGLTTHGASLYNGTIPSGERLVYVAINPSNGDVHLYRQDENGTWSHKFGSTEVQFGVSDPAANAASNGYTVPVQPSGGTNGGYYTIPEQGIDVDG